MTKVRDVIVHHVNLHPNAERAAYRLVLVEIVTDSGLTGVGEVGLAYGVGATGAMQVACEIARNYVIGSDARHVSGIWERVYRNAFWLQGGGPVILGALSAIDQALWDIKGKVLGAPVYELLGGAVRDRIRLYCNGWSRSIGSPEALGERARREAELGFTALKFDPFKYLANGERADLVGTISPSMHRLGIERVQAVREGVGPDVDIILEFHGNLMPLDAMRACADMQEFRPLLVEEPIDSTDAGVLAAIASKIGIPVAAGERIYTNSGFRPYLESGALSVIQPDMGLCGGISEAMKIAASAQAHQVTVQPHNCGGPISTAACLQIGSVIPNLQFQEIFPYFADGRQDAVEEPYERKIKNGYMELPTGPGLGVTLNYDFLRRHATSMRAAA
jgi:galactonate dehydratase